MTTDTSQTPVAVPPEPPQTVAGSSGDLASDLLGDAPSTADPADLDRRLTAPPASSRARRATLVLAVVLVGAAGFLGGAWLQHARGVGATSSSSGFPSGASGMPTGGFPSGGPGSNAGGAGAGGLGTAAATGTVVLVDGKVVYVKAASGTVRVLTTSSTRVTTTSLTGLAKGTSVTVYGTAATDGTVTATAITTAATTTTVGAAPSASPTA
jgi:hypothetical protein